MKIENIDGNLPVTISGSCMEGLQVSCCVDLIQKRLIVFQNGLVDDFSP